ncbi:MAG: hypothetical protein V3V02_00905 [Rhizobiaceae bacterium]
MKNGTKTLLTILGVIMLLPGLCSVIIMIIGDVGGLGTIYSITFLIALFGFLILRHVKNKSQ